MSASSGTPARSSTRVSACSPDGRSVVLGSPLGQALVEEVTKQGGSGAGPTRCEGEFGVAQLRGSWIGRRPSRLVGALQIEATPLGTAMR